MTAQILLLAVVMIVTVVHSFCGYHRVGERVLAKRILAMKLQTGIVGLPNVGKSTLFNALTGQQTAEAANYPFCTIDPNIGVVSVPDKRLEVLGDLNKSKKIVPATLEFKDIAGLVKGASKGEGLGNKFLANIREVDAITHVVRCFENPDVIHVDGSVDPIRDIEVINLELLLADLEQVERRQEKARRDRKTPKEEITALEKLAEVLGADKPARFADLSPEEFQSVKSLGLLTLKKVVYAANVADDDLASGNDFTKRVQEFAVKEGSGVVVVSAQVESELVDLTLEERQAFLEDLGVKDDEVGLRCLVRAVYDLLGLQTYFTSGETETRAWQINRGTLAPQAAGVIHSDFERGFIKADTMAYDDFIACGSEKVAKEKGLYRSEGKEYVVKDGDVIFFKYNV